MGETNGTGAEVKEDYQLIQGSIAAGAGTFTGPAPVSIRYTPPAQRQKYNYQLRFYKDGEELSPSGGITTVIGNHAVKAPLTATAAQLTIFGNAYAENAIYTSVPSVPLQGGETITIFGQLNPNKSKVTPPVPAEPNQTAVSIGTAAYYTAGAHLPGGTDTPGK